MVSSARFARQVDEALVPVLAEGDRLLAGARVVTGPPPVLVAIAAPILGMIVGSDIATTFGSATPSPWLGALNAGLWILAALVIATGQRPMFIAISRQQLICARLTVVRRRPVRVVTVPLTAARIDRYRGGPAMTSIAVKPPGERLLCLHAVGRKRQPGLDDVLMWARRAGVPIGTRPRRRRRPPPSLDYGTSLTGLPQWSNWPDD
jgi:hypothetical protein